MFSVAKIFFFSLYRVQKNNNNKKIQAKRFEPATSWSPSFYSTAASLTLGHYMPLGMIPLVCGGDRHFQYFFFSAKGGRVRTKETIRV
jgi:hypothetical protein